MTMLGWLILAAAFVTLTRTGGPLIARAGQPAPAVDAPAVAPAAIVSDVPAMFPPLKAVAGRPGYWHIARDDRGTFWFVGPDGRPEFLNGVTTVQPALHGRDAAGPHFVSRDLAKTDSTDTGTTDDLHPWADATLRRVRAAGFKSLGAWSHEAFHRLDVPATHDLNLSTWTWGDARRVFSPEWAEAIERAVVSDVKPLRDNRNLVGYYLDNEVDWDGTANPSAYFDGLAAQDPNRQQVVQVIRSLWSSLESFNRDWKATLADWSDLDGWASLPTTAESAPAYERLHADWLYQVARQYFRVTTQLVRQYDPNHLILGVRFRGYAPPPVVRASRGFTDAQSINCYPGQPTVDHATFRMMHELSGGQPVIVSEYSFHALDGRSGNRNRFGFPGQVADQRARAAHYAAYTARLAEVPFVIGADWFQWMDEPPSGRLRDGEDVNFGVVDVFDHPYEQLADAVRATAPRLNVIHATGAGATEPAPAAPLLAGTEAGEAVAQ